MLLANLDDPSPGDQIETTRQAHPWVHSAPRQCKASYGQHNHGNLAELQVGGSWSPSIQSRPLSCDYAIFGPLKKALRNKRFTSSSTCGTDPQRSSGNFTSQPFTALCRSGTSVSTARANTSDIQVLASVTKPPDRFFFNSFYIISIDCLIQHSIFTWLFISFYIFTVDYTI